MSDHNELHTILERLVYTEDEAYPDGCGPDAGVAYDECGRHCIYCGWESEDFGAVEPEHDDDCPILLGRRALEG
jgi:hypothetical protein